MLPTTLPVQHNKPTPCCCGCCSLTTATIIATLFCTFQVIVGVIVNGLLVFQYNSCLSYFEAIIDFKDLPDLEVIYGLTIASICLLSVWLFLAALALRGNSTLNRSLLTPWFLYTYLVTHFDVGTTVYFSVKFQDSYINSDEFWIDGKPTVTLTYLTLMVLFSRGAIIWFINIYLAHVVNRRGAEIDYNNSVLALYILSHLTSLRNDSNSNSEEYRPPQQPQCPEKNCQLPNYLPSYLLDCNRGHLESSWSLNTDALQGVTGYENPLYPRLDHNSISEYRDNNSRLPHGTVPSYEQSIRHQGRNARLPR